MSINGQPVTGLTEEDLPAIRLDAGPAAQAHDARIGLVRQNQPVTVSLAPREKGKVEGEELDCPRWDFTVKAINQFDNPDLYFYRKAGVFVYGVKSPGNAASVGLQTQDILVSIDGKDIASLDDVKAIHAEAIKNVQTNHRVLVNILRNGLLRQIVLDFARDYQKE